MMVYLGFVFKVFTTRPHLSSEGFLDSGLGNIVLDFFTFLFV